MAGPGSDDRSLNEPRSETDIGAILNKVQRQLINLERKIDTLINQSAGRAPERFAPRHSERVLERREGRYEKKPFSKFPGSSSGKPRAYGEKKSDSNFSGGKPGFGKSKKKFVPQRHRADK